MPKNINLYSLNPTIPKIWDSKSHKKCRVISVVPFTGDVADDELMKIKM